MRLTTSSRISAEDVDREIGWFRSQGLVKAM
jgi:hypothetical protein